jgi:hypothetical protein
MNKTRKMKKCEEFCKKDYIPKSNKFNKKISKTFKIPYKLPTKNETSRIYKKCKNMFCDEQCKKYGGKENKQYIKNGFQKTYSKNRINKLKRNGALSGCQDVSLY